MNQPVRTRAVFFIGGYEPKSPQAFFGRLGKQISHFKALWGYECELSPAESWDEDTMSSADILTASTREGWSTTTMFSFLSLDKIVLADFARPLPIRLAKYLISFGDFVLSGTASRFSVHAWRFFLYFLYPFLAVILFSAAALCVSLLTLPWIGAIGVILGLLTFCVALATLGKRWSTNHLMDLWSFSSAFIRGRRVDAEDLLQRYAESIVHRVSTGKFDEVILVGHSTGGMLMIDVLARCLAIERDFGRSAKSVVLLTLGSTALKAGFHPAGKNFRGAVQRLVASDGVKWVEIQCLTDAINFYKTDPVREMGLATEAGKVFPIVRSIKVRDMLMQDTYRKIRKNLFRVHYQYVYANGKPYWYDFFQICCGPMPLYPRVENRVIGSPSMEAQNV